MRMSKINAFIKDNKIENTVKKLVTDGLTSREAKKAAVLTVKENSPEESVHGTSIGAFEVFERGAWLAAHVSPRDRPFEFTPNRGSFYDDCCLQGFKVCLLLLQNNLEVADIPVIATEGGVFTPERMEKDGWGRPYDHHAMAQKTVQMYAWLAENEPQVIAMCPWILANRKMGHHQPA